MLHGVCYEARKFRFYEPFDSDEGKNVLVIFIALLLDKMYEKVVLYHCMFPSFYFTYSKRYL